MVPLTGSGGNGNQGRTGGTAGCASTTPGAKTNPASPRIAPSTFGITVLHDTIIRLS
jgi:hypothetical protein